METVKQPPRKAAPAPPSPTDETVIGNVEGTVYGTVAQKAMELSRQGNGNNVNSPKPDGRGQRDSVTMGRRPAPAAPPVPPPEAVPTSPERSDKPGTNTVRRSLPMPKQPPPEHLIRPGGNEPVEDAPTSGNRNSLSQPQPSNAGFRKQGPPSPTRNDGDATQNNNQFANKRNMVGNVDEGSATMQRRAPPPPQAPAEDQVPPSPRGNGNGLGRAPSINRQTANNTIYRNAELAERFEEAENNEVEDEPVASRPKTSVQMARAMYETGADNRPSSASRPTKAPPVERNSTGTY